MVTRTLSIPRLTMHIIDECWRHRKILQLGSPSNTIPGRRVYLPTLKFSLLLFVPLDYVPHAAWIKCIGYCLTRQRVHVVSKLTSRSQFPGSVNSRSLKIQCTVVLQILRISQYATLRRERRKTMQQAYLGFSVKDRRSTHRSATQRFEAYLETQNPFIIHHNTIILIFILGHNLDIGQR